MATWDAPGRGHWSLERSHFGGVFTVAYRDVYQRGQHDGMRSTMARYGLPVSHMAIGFVNDRPYMRFVPLFEPPARVARRPPPAAMVWLLARLHPAFRRCTRAAKKMLAARQWREDGRRWYEEQKPQMIKANLALQEDPLAAMSDAEMAAHLARAVDNCFEGVRVHFDLVGPDAFPVGDFLVALDGWGVGAEDGLALMAGASPASADSPRLLASGDVDGYLRHYGWRAVANYDVDSPTIGEMPGVVEATVKAVAAAPHTDAALSPEAVRARVPPAERDRFDSLLAEARYAYGIRDDNAGITLQWTVGLLRRALLEAARRLVAGGKLEVLEDVFEVTPDDTRALLLGTGGPSAAEVVRRREARRTNNALDAPRYLGPEEALPPLAPMPPALRRVAAALLIQADLMYSDDEMQLLQGTGIGEVITRGPARVVRSAEDAFDRLQPDDILVTTMTTPAYDAILPIVAALVVEEGGALSHAAIVAREFGLPAVIGARGALDHINDGDIIEVDPKAGTVRVVD